jgi:hypothetical protein
MHAALACHSLNDVLAVTEKMTEVEELCLKVIKETYPTSDSYKGVGQPWQ